MRKAILLVALLSAGCANFEVPQGRVMSASHSNGRIFFKPSKLIYLPEDRLPQIGQFDFGRNMCSIYG